MHLGIGKMKFCKFYALLFLPLLFAGCFKSEQEAVLADLVDYTNEMTDILETVQDEGTAVLAQPKLEKVGKKLEAVVVRMASSFTKGDPQKMKSLIIDYQKPLSEAGKRCKDEVTRVSRIPGIGRDFQEMLASMNTGST